MCVHTLIEKNARRHPDAPAVCTWDGELSYSDLDGFSTLLTHHLVGLRVQVEMFVLLCFEKSKWLVVAMVVVLKTGGACVLLEPSHPMNRLESILNDIKAKVLLASST